MLMRILDSKITTLFIALAFIALAYYAYKSQEVTFAPQSEQQGYSAKQAKKLARLIDKKINEHANIVKYRGALAEMFATQPEE